MAKDANVIVRCQNSDTGRVAREACMKACIGCKRCIREIGCPALSLKDNKALIDETLCTGCTLCEQLCPVTAISGGERL